MTSITINRWLLSTTKMNWVKISTDKRWLRQWFSQPDDNAIIILSRGNTTVYCTCAQVDFMKVFASVLKDHDNGSEHVCIRLRYGTPWAIIIGCWKTWKKTLLVFVFQLRKSYHFKHPRKVLNNEWYVNAG